MAIERGYRAEPGQQGKRLGGVGRAPAPFRPEPPERKVRQQHDRCRGGKPGEIVLEPVELGAAERALAMIAQLHDIDQPDDMHALDVEAVPAVAGGVRTERGIERARIVAVHEVMFAGNEKHRGGQFRQHLLRQVELGRRRQMRDVAGVDDEIGRARQGADTGDRFLERCHRIGVGRFGKSDMGIADLRERQRLRGFSGRRSSDRRGARHPACQHEQASRRQPHAGQRVAPVELVIPIHIPRSA